MCALIEAGQIFTVVDNSFLIDYQLSSHVYLKQPTKSCCVLRKQGVTFIWFIFFHRHHLRILNAGQNGQGQKNSNIASPVILKQSQLSFSWHKHSALTGGIVRTMFDLFHENDFNNNLVFASVKEIKFGFYTMIPCFSFLSSSSSNPEFCGYSLSF